MIKEINVFEYSDQLLTQLVKGAFLTVKSKEKTNTMTIAWGSLGFLWNKPVFTAMVRLSRYTYSLFEESGAEDFTVSFPIQTSLCNELGICGAVSGRDVDKFAEAGIHPEKSMEVNSPVIGECNLFLECKIVFKQRMEEQLLSPEIRNKAYNQGDYHVMYYGEIIKAYRKE